MYNNKNVALPATIVLLIVLSALGYYGIESDANNKTSGIKNKSLSILDYAKQV